MNFGAHIGNFKMTDFKMVANRQVKDKEQDGGVAMEGTLSVVAADISLITAEESERQERQEENKKGSCSKF